MKNTSPKLRDSRAWQCRWWFDRHRRGHLRPTAAALVSAILIAAWLPPVAPAASFRGLGDLPGGTFGSWANAVSADGQVAVGESQSANGREAFRWTAATGMVGLGDLPGGAFSSHGFGVSADGNVIVGDGVSANGGEAFRWTAAAGMAPLGDLPGGGFSSTAWGVSANGLVIAGVSSSTLGTKEAYQWTTTNGMVGLRALPGDILGSTAYAVSADGSVVVGYSGKNAVGEAFRWTATTGMVGLGDFPGGGTNSVAYAVSADGSVVVGRGYSGVFDPYTHEAFRWTAQSGLIALGFAPGDHDSVAWAVSVDGSTIVGDNLSRAIIWDPRHGMRRLREALIADYGLDLTGWQLTSARGITPDGNTMVGSGINPSGQYEAWIATGLRPALIIRQTNEGCCLSWPMSASGFVLQSSDNLMSGWSNIVGSAATNAGSLTVTLRWSGATRYYRLAR